MLRDLLTIGRLTSDPITVPTYCAEGIALPSFTSGTAKPQA